MTDKQLKLIYEYMGWKQGKTKTLPCPQCGYSTTKEHFSLNSNSAWEVVQEMERKGDTQGFERILSNTHSEAMEDINLRSNAVFISYFVWSRNPENFFNCFVEWLESKEVDVLKGCRDHWQASYIDVRRKFLSEKAEVKRLNALRFESGKMVAEAIREAENLACCGNCKLKHNKIECPEYDYEETNPVVSGDCCDKWKSDHLTRTEREIK